MLTLWLVLNFCCTTFLSAQTLDWVKSCGGTGFELLNGMAVDATGHIYTVGSFSSTVDFDPNSAVFNLSSLGQYDLFVQKLDASGNLLWAKGLGGGSWDHGNAIAVDDSSNVYILGSGYGVIDIDPGAGLFNVPEGFFLLKLDSDGIFQWGKPLEGVAATHIQIDQWGNIYTAGIFLGTKDFDPSLDSFKLTSVGKRDLFVQKFDPMGNFIWAKSMGSIEDDDLNALALDQEGNVYTTGSFQNSVDFDPNQDTLLLVSTQGSDIFIHKLDSAGNLVWVKQMGGANWDCSGTDLIIDSTGFVYTIGVFHGTVDFNPNAGVNMFHSNGNKDIFVHKMDTSGHFIWARTFGGISNDHGKGIDIDALGNIYITGVYFGTVDFDPNASVFALPGISAADMFVQKLDASGNFVWAKVMGGYHHDDAKCILIDRNNNILIGGEYWQSVDFDPNAGTTTLTANGGTDFFIQKFSQCTSNGVEAITSCDPITWIDGHVYTSSNDTARYVLTNQAGCDSVVVLNLTIPVVDTTTTLASDSIYANAQGATYQWLDCTNNYALIAGAIDSFYYAGSNGSYAVEITQSGCVDTSTCVHVLGLGWEETSFLEQLSIVPNPTRGAIEIFAQKPEAIALKIWNANGQVIYRNQQIITSSIELSINGAGGLYIVELINTEGKRACFKVLKQ